MNIKEQTTDKKVEHFKNLLNGTITEPDSADILNVYRLVNTYNIFDEDFFENENSYINDISEYIDIKMELVDELKSFSQELAKWYLGIVYSCDIKLSEEDESEMKEMPLLIYGVFSLSSLSMIASILNSCGLDTIKVNELPKVKGAFMMLSKLFNSHSFVASYIDKL